MATPRFRRPRCREPSLGLQARSRSGEKLARTAGVLAARSSRERRLGVVRKPRSVENAAHEVGTEHVPFDGGGGAEVAQVSLE